MLTVPPSLPGSVRSDYRYNSIDLACSLGQPAVHINRPLNRQR